MDSRAGTAGALEPSTTLIVASHHRVADHVIRPGRYWPPHDDEPQPTRCLIFVGWGTCREGQQLVPKTVVSTFPVRRGFSLCMPRAPLDAWIYHERPNTGHLSSNGRYLF
jgi:hypothetical protein